MFSSGDGDVTIQAEGKEDRFILCPFKINTHPQSTAMIPCIVSGKRSPFYAAPPTNTPIPRGYAAPNHRQKNGRGRIGFGASRDKSAGAG